MVRTSFGAYALLVVLLARSLPGSAAEVVLDPAGTLVRIGLDSTLHHIDGEARLAEGRIDFDLAAGAASGRIVVDARSVDTGNSLRDGQLHGKVLESERFPQIVFLPRELRVLERTPDEARVEVSGEMEIHGTRHALVIPATVREEAGRLHILASFAVPHVAWGMRDMSNFLLTVDPVTQIEVDALADSEPAPVELLEGAGAAAR